MSMIIMISPNHNNMMRLKRVKSDFLKNTGNTGHFFKNTGFYRTRKKIQDITGNTGQLRGLLTYANVNISNII